jgi:hypothetical protein
MPIFLPSVQRISTNRRNEQCGEESPHLFDSRKHGTNTDATLTEIIHTRVCGPLETSRTYCTVWCRGVRGSAPYQVAGARWRSRARCGGGGERRREGSRNRGGAGARCSVVAVGFSATCDSSPSFSFFSPFFPLWNLCWGTGAVGS